jgi:acyl-CoA thioesterase
MPHMDSEETTMPKKISLRAEDFNWFGDLIGLKFVQREGGCSQCILKVEKQLLNPQRVLHGGVIYSMADSGMGGALYSCMEQDELCATVEIKISYFKAVISGTLTCNTRILHRTRTLAALESEIIDDSDLIAKATGTFSIFKVKVRETSV